MNKENIKENNKNRYICVFFTSDCEENINKNFKKVIVVEAEKPTEAEDIIIDEKGATYIKSIRDLEVWIYYKYDWDVHRKEEKNNFNM